MTCSQINSLLISCFCDNTHPFKKQIQENRKRSFVAHLIRSMCRNLNTVQYKIAG